MRVEASVETGVENLPGQAAEGTGIVTPLENAAKWLRDDSVLITTADTSVIPATDEFTFSVFLDVRDIGTSTTGTQYVFYGSNSGATPTFEVHVNNTHNVVVRINNGDNGTATMTASLNGLTYPLVQVAYSNITDTFQLYLNGVAAPYTGTITFATLPTRSGFAIGGHPASSGWGAKMITRALWFSHKFFDLSTLPLNGAPPPSAAPLVYFNGDATAWNYGQHAGSLPKLVMRGRGVNFPASVNKIAFREIHPPGTTNIPSYYPVTNVWVDDATSTNWTAIGSPAGGATWTPHTGQRKIFTNAMRMQNSAGGVYEGWSRTWGTAWAAEASSNYRDLPLNFCFDILWLAADPNRAIRITISDEAAATNSHQYNFALSQAGNCGGFILTVDPTLAGATSIAADSGNLPKGYSVTKVGNGWTRANGIRYVLIEFQQFDIYSSSQLWAGYLGFTRGQHHTAVIMNTMDDGGDTIITTQHSGQSNKTVKDFLVERNMPVSLGIIGNVVGQYANTLTPAELQTLYELGAEMNTHGEYSLLVPYALDITLSGAGAVFPAIGTTISKNGVSGDVAWVHDYGNQSGSIMLHSVGNPNGRLSTTGWGGTYPVTWSGQVGTAQSISGLRGLTVEEIKENVSSNYDKIVELDFDVESAKFYMYPLGAIRNWTQAAGENVAWALSELGFKLGFSTTGFFTSFPKGYGSNAAYAMSRISLENETSSYPMPVGSEWYYSILMLNGIKAGVAYGAMTHNYDPVGTAEAADDSRIVIDDMYTFISAWNTYRTSGQLKIMTVNDFYNQIVQHVPWQTLKARTDAPGTPYILTATDQTLSAGDVLSLQIKRSAGFDLWGAISVDVTVSPPVFTSGNTFSVQWIPLGFGDITQTFARTAASVAVDTPFTITLSNPRRLDGGPNVPVLGSPSQISGIVYAAAGEASLVGGTYSTEEGGYFVVTADLQGGNSGDVTLDVVLDDTDISFPFGTTHQISWPAGASGQASVTIDVGELTGIVDGSFTFTLENIQGTTSAPTINQSAKTGTVSVTKKVPIQQWDGSYSFPYLSWLESMFNIKKNLVVYMVDLWPAGKAESSDWTIIDAAHITALAQSLAAQGYTQAVLDVEKVEGRNGSEIYKLYGDLYFPIVEAANRPLGVQRMSEIVQAFKAGFGNGRVGVYTETNFAEEIARVYNLEGNSARYQAFLAHQRQVWEDCQPLADVSDFMVLSIYGNWYKYDPIYTGTQDSPARSITQYATDYELGMEISYQEIIGALGYRQPVVWFMKTSNPNLDQDGNYLNNVPACRYPIEFPEFFCNKLLEIVPAGKRELYWWAGDYPAAMQIPQWTPIEVCNMICFGTINDNNYTVDDNPSYVSGYFYMADPNKTWNYREPAIEVNESGTFTITVGHAPSLAQAGHTTRTVTITPPVGSVQGARTSDVLTWNPDTSGKRTTQTFQANLVSLDTTYSVGGVADPATVSRSGNQSAFNRGWVPGSPAGYWLPVAVTNNLLIKNVVAPGTVTILDNGYSTEELQTEVVTARRANGSEGDISVPLVFSDPTKVTLSLPAFVWTNGDTTDKTITVTAGNVGADTTYTMTLGTPTVGSPTITPNTPVNFIITNAAAPVAVPGTINLTNSNTTLTVGQSFDLGFSRTVGDDGAVTAIASLSADIARTSWGTNNTQVAFAADSTTATFPYAPATFTATTPGSAQITLGTPTGTLGLPTLAGYPKTLTVNAVQSTGDYTLAVALQRNPLPFTFNSPTLPTLGASPDITVTSQAEFVAALAQTGKRITVNAGTYTDLSITSTNQEIILSAGVYIDQISFTGTARYIYLHGNPARAALVKTLRLGDGGSVASKDILIDGITFDGTSYIATNTTRYYNNVNAIRLVVINCNILTRGSALRGFSYSGAEQNADWLFGNNYIYDMGYGDLPTAQQPTDPSYTWRTTGNLRQVLVDNLVYSRWDNQVGGLRQMIRIHAQQGGIDSADTYMRKNLFVGPGHMWQRSGDGNQTGKNLRMYYVDNTQYAIGINSGYLTPADQFADLPINCSNKLPPEGPGNYYTSGNGPDQLTITGNKIRTDIGQSMFTMTIEPYQTVISSPNDFVQQAESITRAEGLAAIEAWTFNSWKDSYGVANIQERYPVPFAWGTPLQVAALPNINNSLQDITITTVNVGSYTGANSSAANTRRLRFTAGTYGDVEIFGLDQDIIFTSGVVINELRVHGSCRRVRFSANPARTGTIAALRVGDPNLGSGLVPQDITFDGITQLYVANGTPNNHITVQRLVLINCDLRQRNFVFVSYSGLGALRLQDVILGNNIMQSLGSAAGGSGDTGNVIRTQGATRFMYVDNRFVANGAESVWRQNVRIHSQADQAGTYHYMAGNQGEQTEHAFGKGNITDPKLQYIWYVGNLDYRRTVPSGATKAINYNTGSGSYEYAPEYHTRQYNVLYHNQNYEALPGVLGFVSTPAGTWTNQIDVTPSNWDFNKWKSFNPLLNQAPPHVY